MAFLCCGAVKQLPSIGELSLRDVLLSGLVRAGGTAGLSIDGPCASLPVGLFLSGFCCIGVMSDPH